MSLKATTTLTGQTSTQLGSRANLFISEKKCYICTYSLSFLLHHLIYTGNEAIRYHKMLRQAKAPCK